MALIPGTRLGPYEIVSALGAGGMGEVYRATDPNLGRQVAIKVLPDAIAHDPERVARFEREARTLATLNHPNIAIVHGFEKGDGVRALVMELVEGPTLADRLAQGPLPVDEALSIAKEIAEALEAAHEQGIVHRDLKPANIKLRPDGQIKVLDFGLAKAFTTESVGPSSAALTNSPTLTSPIGMTGVGIILGTAAYMAPEQAKGKAVDRRADIWAFGVVTCEMLIGRPLYDGETAQETLARVIEREPDVASLPAATPPFIRDLLRRCLTKDPRARLQAIGEARIALEQAIAHPHGGHTVSGGVPTSFRSSALSVVPWVTSAVLGAGLLVVLTWAKPWQPAPLTATMQVRAELGADVSIVTTIGAPGASLALSPDGSLLVFVGQTKTATQLYSRRLDQLIASPIAGTAGARDPFFSHDGRSIAFFADGKLKWLDLPGGPASAIADAPTDRGGAWGDDGNIVYMPAGGSSGPLMRVSAAGGTAEAVTRLADGEVTHRWPQILPGARAIVYTAHSAPNSLDTANIVVQPLPTGMPQIVHRGGYHARVLPSGHLVFIQDGALFAAPFDADRLEVTRRPVRIVEGIAANSGTGGAHYAVSTTGRLGRLVYLSGEAASVSQPIMWVDRKGTRAPLRSAPSVWRNPNFSPDGRHLAVDIGDLASDISLIDLARDASTKLTFNPESDQRAVWTPNGSRIVYSSNYRGKTLNLHWVRADGSSAEPQRLTESNNVQFAGSWHPSGRFLAFTEIRAETSSSDLLILEIQGDESAGWKIGQPTVFLATTSNESEPMFSPDGNWIAYQSNQGSTVDVYVRPFPGPGGVRPVSTDGGLMPVWSRTRRELLYRTQDSRMMVVSYSTDGRSFQPDKPKPWSDPPVLVLQRPGQRSFDLHPDGDRIAGSIATEAEWASADTVVIIENFFDELKRRVPTK